MKGSSEEAILGQKKWRGKSGRVELLCEEEKRKERRPRCRRRAGKGDGAERDRERDGKER